MVKKSLNLLLVIFFLLLSKNQVQAITASVPVFEKDGEIQVVEDPDFDLGEMITSNINIYNAKIVDQKGDKIKIAFDIENDDQIRTDIRYSVDLLEEKEREGSLVLLNRKVYPDKLYLEENKTIHKEIEYDLPEFFEGNFKLFVTLSTSGGATLSFGEAGDINIPKSENFLKIIAESCYFKVNNEDSKYNMLQGVAVEKNDELLVNCEVQNFFNEEKIFKTKIETFRRNLFGEKTAFEIAAKNGISLKPGEKKEFQFLLERPQAPQAYSAELSLVSDGKVVSNSVEMHYVVHGISGTIQSINLDKDSYKKGDNFGMILTISGPADNFAGSRLATSKIEEIPTEIEVTDLNGVECLSLKDTIFSDYLMSDYSVVEMPVDCHNPQVKVTIRDENGNVLDEKTVKVKSQEKTNQNISEKSIPGKSAEEDRKSFYLLLIISISAIVAITSGLLLLRRFLVDRK